jgi:hypothetical protein
MGGEVMAQQMMNQTGGLMVQSARYPGPAASNGAGTPIS